MTHPGPLWHDQPVPLTGTVHDPAQVVPELDYGSGSFPAPPTPPPPPRLRRSPMLVGPAPPIRPELLRHPQAPDGHTRSIIGQLARLAAVAVVNVALVVWLTLAHIL